MQRRTTIRPFFIDDPISSKNPTNRVSSIFGKGILKITSELPMSIYVRSLCLLPFFNCLSKVDPQTSLRPRTFPNPFRPRFFAGPHKVHHDASWALIINITFMVATARLLGVRLQVGLLWGGVGVPHHGLRAGEGPAYPTMPVALPPMTWQLGAWPTH